jgi:trehalose 6-phosphate synthase/phosphatase
VRRNSVFAWAERFLDSLRQAVAGRGERERPALLPAEETAHRYAAAQRRLVLLDYDGTLVPFARTPREAVPPRGLADVLDALVRAEPGAVCLISGRTRADLTRWFGGVKGLWLVAEHGALVRRPGGDWEPLRSGGVDAEWKARVRPVLEHFVDRTPGSFIEEKEYGLVWHYRLADPEFAPWLANELSATLEQMLAETEQRAVRAHRAVEVRPAWANKGGVLAFMEAAAPGADFRLAIGDDRTDEDLFEQMPPGAVTVHVGPGASRARFGLPDPPSVRRFLERLALAQPAPARPHVEDLAFSAGARSAI